MLATPSDQAPLRERQLRRKMRWFGATLEDVRVVSGAGASAGLVTEEPDPLFESQWHLDPEQVNEASADLGVGIRGPAMWAELEAAGMLPWADRPRIAVIDNGVDPTHPDLAANLELPGRNFTGGDPEATTDLVNPHGTAVAGLIGAVRGNDEGIAGVCPSPLIVPVRVFNVMGFGSELWAAQGLVWAADQGVDVAVMPFAFSEGTDVFRDAVAYALDSGVVLVAAVGNTGSSVGQYPAAFDGVIGVGATQLGGDLAVFSNTGSAVSLVAPGVSLLTTMPNGGYGYVNGTSYSAPLVAGAAAAIAGINPDLTPDEIAEILFESATDAGDAGPDAVFGSGLLDAGTAAWVAGESVGTPACAADLDANGILSGADFLAFIDAFSAGDPAADLNGDGVISGTDFMTMVMMFQQGC